MARKLSVLGIDMAKLVLHVVGMDDTGAVVLRKRIARSEVLHCIATLPPLRIGMEACGSAHSWARCLQAHGHDVRLIAPQFVKAYVKSPKNDARDAAVIWAAVTRPTMRLVPIKRVEQQDLQALHRVRERLIKARTALVNAIRGLLNASSPAARPEAARAAPDGGGAAGLWAAPGVWQRPPPGARTAPPAPAPRASRGRPWLSRPAARPPAEGAEGAGPP
jgi:transposase